MNDLATVVLIVLGFWLLALGIGGLAAAFTTLACIIHFQIIGALGAFILAGTCWFIANIIYCTYD